MPSSTYPAAVDTGVRSVSPWSTAPGSNVSTRRNPMVIRAVSRSGEWCRSGTSLSRSRDHCGCTSRRGWTRSSRGSSMGFVRTSCPIAFRVSVTKQSCLTDPIFGTRRTSPCFRWTPSGRSAGDRSPSKPWTRCVGPRSRSARRRCWHWLERFAATVWNEPWFYAPWRDDPRPLNGVLHGIYAFTSVVEFWCARRRQVPEDQAAAADFAFVLRSLQVRAAIDDIASSAPLNEWGGLFLETLSSRLAACEVDLTEARKPSSIRDGTEDTAGRGEPACPEESEQRQRIAVRLGDEPVWDPVVERERVPRGWRPGRPTRRRSTAAARSTPLPRTASETRTPRWRSRPRRGGRGRPSPATTPSPAIARRPPSTTPAAHRSP
jgi:hypothetical protein